MTSSNLAAPLGLAALIGCASAPRSASTPCPAPSEPTHAGGQADAASPRLPFLIQNVQGRKTTSLNGAWRAIVDPFENGYYDYRYQPHTSEGYFQNRKPTSRSDRIEYDFDASAPLQVPGDWNSQRPELLFYEGTIWYKRDFVSTGTEAARLFLHFGAANYQARVYLNGHELGVHEGGFTPFMFEITDRVTPGTNFLVVKVDNQRRADAIPTLNTDWWNYGGLTRDVTLIEVPETFIQDYSLGLGPNGREITGWVQLEGARRSQLLRLRVPEVGAEASVRTDATGRAEVRLPAKLELWSPESPRLYEVEIEAETDRVRERLGFRSIEARGEDVLLNGNPIFLRGISIHEQAPLRPGRAHSEADARTLLGWAKELGANFVRLAHYPHNEHMTRVADELGLLVWSEIPVYWTITWENAGTLENAKQQLGEMITRDRNRASVIVWSLGNETPLSDARLRFMTALARTARALDETRLISAALERHYTDERTQMIDDPLGEVLDLIGCNEYLGWYDGLPEKIDGIRWQTAYEKPLVISEFGADALAGHHGDALTRWSEEYQADVYRRQLAMLGKIRSLRGMTPWVLTDFRSPRRPLPGIQDYWNRKGLISDRGVKKQAFHVLKEHYQSIARSWPATPAGRNR